MERPLVSIIIRTYNEEKHIARLLEGIFHQTVKDVEVILVDSGLRDATVSIARRWPVNICSVQPEGIAQAILFLADNDPSSFMTGSALVLDGRGTARLSAR